MKEYASLKPFNTLGVNASARYLCPANSESDIAAICRFSREQGLPLIPLGGGSNIVLREHIEAVVMPVAIEYQQIKVVTQDQAFVSVGAGCNWHALVRWTLKNRLYGLENLSLIPGNTGAAPVQNIGAYGVELKDTLVQVRGYHRSTQAYVTLSKEACAFGYRDSVFKQALCNDFIITEVVLCLSRTLTPYLAYGKLQKVVEEICGSEHLTGLGISDAVCRIREDKLPDPGIIGNAGSFFKNPVVSSDVFEQLRSDHPNMVAFAQGDKHWKLAAGWLIDTCGLKGYQENAVGTYNKQALVLINYGGATGKDILGFASMIQNTVYQRFHIMLEIEPMIYPDCL